MKTIVITVLDDVCAKNGRDPEALTLIEKAKLYGKVESGEQYVAGVRIEDQAIINNLVSQLEAIKENEVSPAELEILKALRQKARNEGKVYEDEISALKNQLKRVVEEGENRTKAIRAILGES